MKSKSVTEVTKMKKQTSKNKKKGDDGEKFVYDLLTNMTYITEIHPRTYHPVFLKNGKRVMVSGDNDYHNLFDLKAEREDNMIYAQVKWYKTGKIDHGQVSNAKKNIDRKYPYSFRYQRLQVWMVWKEWVRKEGKRRHKEFKFRVWERKGIREWIEVTEQIRSEFLQFSIRIEEEGVQNKKDDKIYSDMKKGEPVPMKTPNRRVENK